MNLKSLFFALYEAPNEQAVEQVLHQSEYQSVMSQQVNWKPLGGNKDSFGVIENQQASPIAALIEKLTNSIDALLMRKCYEHNIDPKSNDAPQTMEIAVAQFFLNRKNWDLVKERKKQAGHLQVLADGIFKERNKNTSLIIYDNGQGQHPEDFEKTFLSLLRGNKNEIPFVQGKYNMGGTGAIVFCGKKRYQLIASKKYTNDGPFGFTLIRKHPLTEAEKNSNIKNTWYEYFVYEGKIPAFDCDELDLNLHKCLFKTGSIIKLYSYQLPSSSSSDISRDLNQSINEYLFKPALPIFTIEKKERYPKSSLFRELYGLKRRLEKTDNKYIEEFFSEKGEFDQIGNMYVTCYVFKPKIEGKSVKESKEAIKREFFKNNMSVLFGMNGQVHGHYTSEFITRSLKMSLLKNHLLIYVDCSHMHMEFRNELFMASRDRLKKGEESVLLRKKLTNILKQSKLKAIHNKRKQGITLDVTQEKDLLTTLVQKLPQNQALFSLLNKTFHIEQKHNSLNKKNTSNASPSKKTTPSSSNKEDFKPKRYPSAFKLKTKGKKDKDGIPVIQVPLGSEKTINFSTDAENQYFDRVEDPGEFTIDILGQEPETTDGENGNEVGTQNQTAQSINVRRTSPDQGTIKVVVESSKKKTKIGDRIKVKVILGNKGDDFEQFFWIKITDPLKAPKNKQEEPEQLGLPSCKRVYQQTKANYLDWATLEDKAGIGMNYDIVMYPFIDEDKLDCIYINMDSTVLKNYKSKLKNASYEQLELADKKYLTAIYFHTLFLYTITKKRQYNIHQLNQETAEPIEVDLVDYLKDIFNSYYAEFLLSFGLEDLMNSLEA